MIDYDTWKKQVQVIEAENGDIFFIECHNCDIRFIIRYLKEEFGFDAKEEDLQEKYFRCTLGKLEEINECNRYFWRSIYKKGKGAIHGYVYPEGKC